MADDDDDASKTEEPTGRRLSKAREKGQVALSQEVKIGFLLLGTAFALFTFIPSMAKHIQAISTPYIESPHSIALDPGSLQRMMVDLSQEMAIATWPIFILLMVMAVAATIGQIGLLWAPEKIRPKLAAISPLAGFKRLVSIQQMVEFAKGVAKLIAVGAISYFMAMPLLKDLDLIPGMGMGAIVQRLEDITFSLIASTVAVMVALAGLDWFYQKFSFMKKMRMTKQEVKEEVKQTEGDPHIKAKIRSLRVARARQRMMQAVPRASVVITNPTHYAVALHYEMEAMGAPRLVAKGVDHIALRIREVAEENDVPIVENPPLARALYATVELDQEIPPEHYKAVAEVIGYVMRLRGELKGEPERPRTQ
ncbi:MAG: flagellar biosynthesis protein FlhB [Magnetospirillum sp. WYHS-4]